MDFEFQIGVRVKWLLIGLGIFILGSILGSIGGWEAASFINILAIIVCVFGGIVTVVSLVATMIHDFEYNE
jgi:hypothetical protein